PPGAGPPGPPGSGELSRTRTPVTRPHEAPPTERLSRPPGGGTPLRFPYSACRIRTFRQPRPGPFPSVPRATVVRSAEDAGCGTPPILPNPRVPSTPYWVLMAPDAAQAAQPPAPPGPAAPVREKVRVRFRKGGDLRLLSHHDLMRPFERLLRRASLPFRSSEG